MRTAKARAREAAESACVTSEQVVDVGVAWGTRMRDGVSLLFLARRQFFVALTDRRLLVFDRRAKGAPRTPGPLVIGKRYEFFSLERTRRRPILYQVVLRGENDTRLVFEFRPNQRALGRALVERVSGATSVPASALGGSDGGPTESFWGSR